MDRPNILLIMTDEERYPPPYEADSVQGLPQARNSPPGSRSDHVGSSSTGTTPDPRPARPVERPSSPGSTPRFTG